MCAYSLSEIVKKILSNTYDKLIEDNTIIADFLINEEFKLNMINPVIIIFGKKKCVLSFKLTINTNERQIVWKTKNQDFFYGLKINDNEDGSVHNLCKKFILGELRHNRSGKC